MAGLSPLLNTLHLSLRSIWQPTVFGVRTFLEDRDGRIALVRHSYKPGWFLPGGGAEHREMPEEAAMREAVEEVGLVSSATPEFFGLYVQSRARITNVVAVFHLRDAVLDFRRSFEIREFMWADPNTPPAATSDATLRRLAEFTGKAAKSSRW